MNQEREGLNVQGYRIRIIQGFKEGLAQWLCQYYSSLKKTFVAQLNKKNIILIQDSCFNVGLYLKVLQIVSCNC